MTSLVTFTSAPAILGGKKNCSALSAARGATRAEISYALAEINWKSLEISWKSRKSG